MTTAELSDAMVDLKAFVEHGFARLDEKIDNVESRIIHSVNKMFDEQIARWDARFGQVEGRLDGIEGRLDRVESELKGVRVDLKTLDGRVARLEANSIRGN